jgi:hypothetical protein
VTRTTVCLGCGDRTTNGSRCPRCSGGRRCTPRTTAYRDPRYVRLRRQALAEHRATFGPRCPRCLRPEDRAIRSSWLTVNHITPLSLGGHILGPTEVICLRCNVQQEHVDRPDIARRGRAS